jgi:hypothetical protein
MTTNDIDVWRTTSGRHLPIIARNLLPPAGLLRDLLLDNQFSGRQGGPRPSCQTHLPW